MKKTKQFLTCPKQGIHIFLCLLAAVFFSAASLYIPADSYAADTVTVITSDNLEYSSETRQYVAKGSVKIVRDNTIITADEMTYDEATSDVLAQGSVDYRDSDTSMKAVKAELNMEEKTGTLYDASIFFAEGNYHMSGEVLEKTGENSYYSPSAVYTTCDAPLPAWCFKGKNVDLALGDKIKSHDTTFRIEDVPVLYTPYLISPILTTRQTGFLLPVPSQSKSRGFGLNIPFYWAIAENMDATFMLDIYTKRGIGEGIEYRFVEPGVKGYLRAYHIYDTETSTDFWEMKGLYENRSSERLGGFLNLNILNEKDFYRTFSMHLETRTQRFLESTGELNLPMQNSRAYLLSQYWIDLKTGTPPVAEKLPEAGFVLNYTNIGSTLFSGSLNAANLWRDGGISAGRADLYPKLLYSLGTDFVVSQTAAFRATSYSFYKDAPQDDSPLRTAFEYDVVGHTRLYRKYDSFTHVVEPSIQYHFISSSENNLPIFDSTELFQQTSLVELAVLNRIMAGGSEVATLRLSQPFNTRNSKQPFLPLILELGTSRWLPMKLGATYNEYSGSLETVTSELGLSVLGAGVSLGESYNRPQNIMTYRAGLTFNPYDRVNVISNILYDAKGGGLRDLDFTVKYQRQCWALDFKFIKRPGDYTMTVMVELLGLNMKPLKEN